MLLGHLNINIYRMVNILNELAGKNILKIKGI
jgi:hypothetical protein